MSRGLVDVRNEALQLSPQERLQLAEDLHASVLTPEEQEVEDAWIDEAERRRGEWLAGRAVTVPGEKVIARLRDQYGRDGVRASRRR